MGNTSAMGLDIMASVIDLDNNGLARRYGQQSRSLASTILE
ncbi:hypothetical protein [Agrobacterium cavarae]